MRALAPLPFSIVWVDTRERVFPQRIPDNVKIAASADPVYEVNQALANSWYLVMTHDHGQDFEITRAILDRDDFAHLGLIGSKTKKHRFQHRLKHRGYASECIERINCPIGVAGLESKQPAVIAASVAVQLLQLREQYVKAALKGENLLAPSAIRYLHL